MDIRETDRQYIAETYRRSAFLPVSGMGSVLIDRSGRHYIDMGSGIGVNCLGTNDRKWQSAVIRQLRRMGHVSNLYCNEPAALLARELCTRTKMAKVFFCNSGAEANEAAIKVARKYARSVKGDRYYHILTVTGSFHGRTLTTLAATGQERFHRQFRPLTPGFLHIPANDEAALRQAVDRYPLAGILLECIQGEGGVLPLSGSFLQLAHQLSRRSDIPLIIDEVQTGNGRTGMLYSYMHHGIQPDIITTAKGLGGGLPIGAAILSGKLSRVLEPGDHGSTFGGNPICCAGALQVLKRLDDAFLLSVRRKGAYLQNALRGSPGILQVTGCGLMVGLQTRLPATEVVERARKRGVLLLTAQDRIRLLPPLNIPHNLLRQAAERIRQSCRD